MAAADKSLSAMAEETIKATFLLTPTAKYRIASLKARLRRKGIVETESSLVERLLSTSSLSALEAEITRSTEQRKPR